MHFAAARELVATLNRRESRKPVVLEKPTPCRNQATSAKIHNDGEMADD